MSKSKIFQYCLISGIVAITAIWATNANLQTQSKAANQNELLAKLDSPAENFARVAEADFFASAAMAENPENLDMPAGRILKHLNLSPDQIQKLKAIRDRDHQQIRDLTQQSRQASNELKELLAGTSSSDVLRDQHNRVLQLQQELRKQHFERMLAMRDVLTPQQRSQLKDLMQKKRAQFREGFRDRLDSRMPRRMEKNY